MWLIRDLSLPHLAHHKARTMLTLLGIAIGVGAIVATSSVTDAVFRSFRRTVEATAGRAELLITSGSGGVSEALLEQVKGVPGVAAATALVSGFVSVGDIEREPLAIFGLDLLADEEHEAQIPRAAVHVPDEIVFVSQLDSVALAQDFARARGHAMDSKLDVTTPAGRRQLIVRGLVDAAGPASLYGGAVGLMDLPGAQRLLAKEGRVDRIDVRLAPEADRQEITHRLEAAVRGQARVEDVTAAGAKAEELLFSLRVSLGIAGLIAVLVGFFIIYHTVSVSILQRRREIALLSAFGLSGWYLLRWLATESALLALVAAGVGVALGHLLAQAAVGTFATVATAWVQLPAERATLHVSGALLAIGVGIFTALAATVAPAWSLVSRPPARHLRLAAATPPARRKALHASVAAAVGLALTGLLVAISPRTLPFGPLVVFVFAVNCLALTSFALLSPTAAFVLGRALGRFADRAPGLGLLLASGSITHAPTAPTAVVAAIVMGLGWSLAQSSLTASMEHSWLSWLDQHYQSDLVVTAGGATVSFLTQPPIAEGLADEIRTLGGVKEVQALRNIEIVYGGRPAVLLGMDQAAQGLPLIAGRWEDIAGDFWAGKGVAISDNLAHKTGVATGEAISLPTPTGLVTLPILGIFSDYQSGGDLGCVAISRTLVRDRWQDRLVTRLRVWLTAGTPPEAVRAEIDRRFGATHGLHTLTFAEARAAVADLVRSAFSISYALVLIALTISFVGVLNFLLAAVLDRGPELRVLTAVGVSPAQIVLAIVSEGALIGLVGALVGLVAGVVMSRIIVLHSVPMVNGWHFTWVMPHGTAAILVGTVIALSALAGLFPARVAARTRSSTRDYFE